MSLCTVSKSVCVEMVGFLLCCALFLTPLAIHLVADLFEFQLASTLMARLLESNVVELSQRMNAMGNASSNADEMLAKITLTYNRARQAKITTELIEIISGAIALEG